METPASAIKPPTTIAEQIDLLRSRNLIISDDSEAARILTRVNYYRLSAYMLSVKRGDRFIDGTTLNNVLDLYEFDKMLRNLLMDMLEIIEVSFRTHIAYTHAHKYGSLGYLDSTNFFRADRHKMFIEDLLRETARADELFVKHHKAKYGGQFPIWVAVELLSFGTLSKLYSNMKNEDQDGIAKEYYNNIPYKYISSWLQVLSYTRNICAHYGRIYDRRLKFFPRLYSADAKVIKANDRVFAAIYVMKKLCLDERKWRSFVTRLRAAIDEYEDVLDMARIGFPEDWVRILEA
jgi:Abortive infection bacteriophage resistance protein